MTTDECDHTGFVESEDSAEPGMNTSTNKQVCLSRSWKEWDVEKAGGSVCHQLLVALRVPRIRLGCTTAEHLEESLDNI